MRHSPAYSTSALNTYQSTVKRYSERRIPLVYGTDVFLQNPIVLSHKTSAISGALRHESIVAISYGADTPDAVGEIGLVDSNLYSNGVKLSSDRVVETRSGKSVSPAYPTHASIYKSFPVSGTQITLPSVLPDGSVVVDGEAFYMQGGTWKSVALSPNITATSAAPFLWVSVKTSSPAIFNSIATGLTQSLSMSQNFTHPDVYVRQGRTINRIIGAGRGGYQPDSTHTISGASSNLISVASGRITPLPFTSSNLTDFNFDDEWIVVRKGVSDRFPDVVNDLITTSAGGSLKLTNSGALIDYKSFVYANSHSESLGLKYSGYITEPISIFDFVNDNALFFDLITMRDRSRIALLPHIVTDPYILGIFTAFNCASMSLNFESLTDHYATSVSGIMDEDSNIGSYTPKLSGIYRNPLILKSSEVVRDVGVLRRQLPRILDSVNRQDRSIELISPLGYNQLRAGDFIIAASDDWDDDRAYNGGLLKTNTSDVYTCALENVYTAFTIESNTNNSFVFDFGNRKDSYSPVNFVSGDILVIKLSSDSTIYGRVTDVINSVGNTKILFEVVTFDSNKLDWNRIPGNVTLPSGSQITQYKVGGYPTGAYFYDPEGVPRKGNLRLFVEPRRGDVNSRLNTFVKFDYDGYVADSTPIIFERGTDLWRVSSIESIDSGRLYGRASPISPQIRRVEGYAIRADIYPFADAKTYPGVTKPAVVSIDTPEIITAVSSVDAKEYLVDLAIGNEFTGSDNVVHKWRSGVIKVAIGGIPTTADRARVLEVINTITSITGQIISVVTSGADISITIAPESGFPALDPTYTPKNLGYFSASLDTATKNIVSGVVLIDNAETSQVERDHLILEEVAQLICGIPNDSFKYDDSMFQQRWTVTRDLSVIDREVIKLMSNPAITSGMTAAQLKATIANL